MNQNLKDLLEKVSADEALRAKFEPIATMEDKAAATEAVLALAAEAGVPLAAADLEPDGELDLDELGAVTGGTGLVSNGTCGCVITGIGISGDLDKGCPCAVVGIGEAYMDKRYEEGNKEVRCACSTFGGGTSRD